VDTIRWLAIDLGADERTLRRAVSQGTIRARRTGPRRLRLLSGEAEYLRDYWPLLSTLRRAFRTERQVRLAVLYGSVARGEDDADSDLDLLVSVDGEEAFALTPLVRRLEAVSCRAVDIPRFEQVVTKTPLLLDRVLMDGRVIVDRNNHWPRLQEQRRAIRARAGRAYGKQMGEAAEAIEQLTR